MKRLWSDESGATSIEAVFVALSSLVLLLLFILFAPHGWLQIQRVARAASTLADIAAREPVWTQKMLDELASEVAPRLTDPLAASVTIAIAKIIRASPELPAKAVVCIGTNMRAGQASPLAEGAPLGLDQVLLRTGDSIIFARIEADVELIKASGNFFKEMSFRIARSATSRPINGATRYSDKNNPKAPKTCGA